MATHIGTWKQLAAVGPQDLHLSINPSFSFFDNHIVKHSPFVSTHSFLPFFDTQATQYMTINVPSDGDILSDLALFLSGTPVQQNTGAECLLSDGGFVPSPVKRIQVLVNGQIVHDVDAAAHFLVDSAMCSKEQVGKLRALSKTDNSGVCELFIPIKWRILLPLISMTSSVVTVKLYLSEYWENLSRADLLCTYTKLGDREISDFQNEELDILYDQYESSSHSNSIVDNDMEVFYKTNLNIDLGSLQSPTKCILFAIEENTPSGVSVVSDVVESVQLTIGGIQLSPDPQPAEIYSVLNAYKFTDGFLCTSRKPVYLHSFSLNPISPSPCGSLNMSQYVKKYLSVNFKRTGDFTVRICAVSINVLKVKDRQATVMFA